jgi:hypothetical protein
LFTKAIDIKDGVINFNVKIWFIVFMKINGTLS